MASECASRSHLDQTQEPRRARGAVDWPTIKAARLLPGLYEAIKRMDKDDNDFSDPRLDCAKYYRIQSNQILGNEHIPVPIYIDYSTLGQSWFLPLFNGMNTINTAAPGLKLHIVINKSDANIFVGGNTGDGCWTLGNHLLHKPVEISLDKSWPDSAKGGTAIHEMLHALGFQHEHKRSDGEKYLDYHLEGLDPKWIWNYEVSEFVTGITRFDPHSIMMYPLSKVLEKNAKGDTVWKTINAEGERSQALSELDKVSMNLLYRPVVHENYTPKKSLLTGLKYCGRHTVNTDDGVCGPKQGANCPACRVLKTTKSAEIYESRKWQGWSGLVYCGKFFRKAENDHDGYCGPNNGPQCDECHKLLYPDD